MSATMSSGMSTRNGRTAVSAFVESLLIFVLLVSMLTRRSCATRRALESRNVHSPRAAKTLHMPRIRLVSTTTIRRTAPARVRDTPWSRPGSDFGVPAAMAAHEHRHDDHGRAQTDEQDEEVVRGAMAA